MRAAEEKLRQAGIPNARKVLRLGAAAMIENTMAWWVRQRNAGPGLLAEQVLAGGVPISESTPPTSRCTLSAELGARWDAVVGAVRAELGDDTFEVWLAPIHPHRHDETGWVLAHPRPEVLAWLRQRFAPAVERVVSEPVRFEACEGE